MNQSSVPQGIPIRHVRLSHLSELPNDYGTTPGGTYFSTTPGGTRIIYDRSFLLKCRASPMSNTPPTNLPDIPGVTSPDKSSLKAITKIVEEPEPVNGKENKKGIIPSPMAYYGMEPQGPLQQYRQRNMQQHHGSIMYDSSYNSTPSPISPIMFKFPPYHHPSHPYFDPNNNISSQNSHGDGYWHHHHSFTPSPVKSQSFTVKIPGANYPASQLSVWRQAKINQAITQAMSQANNSQNPSPNLFQSMPPYGVVLNRGRGRGISNKIPGNLCPQMEKLFMSQQGRQHYPMHGYNQISSVDKRDGNLSQ